MSTESAGREAPQSEAIEIFSAWLKTRTDPAAIPFDALLAAHPGHSSELEELHRTWKELVSAAELSAVLDEPTESSARFRLTPRHETAARYKHEGEVARGGMGAILRVWDEDLRRHLAMKVALDAVDAPDSVAGDARARSADKRLARFLEEARVAGQLEHPGMVPVHDLGLDGEGRLYFTMKLVEGRDLRQIFELVRTEREGWNQTRALGVVLKVCEAMAYAHSKNVIHRDLKPANIMVGSFGEVFVMDWGLARVPQHADPHDLRIAPRSASIQSQTASSSALVTMDGVVLGTPAYMPPEQARGEIEKLSARSDVYSVGAMLYHLLARTMPYEAPQAHTDDRYVLRCVLEGPPTPLLDLNSAVPPELVAICEKAMARSSDERYSDMRAFAEDLRAFLEHRVVAAYETGAVAELRKWIARNRGLATASAAALAILVIGLVVSALLFVRAKNASERADTRAAELVLANAALAKETARAEEQANEAERNRKIAEQRSADVLSLSAARDLQRLVARAEAYWPTRPEDADSYEEWLRDAHVLLDGRPADAARGLKSKPGLADHREKLVELEARALPATEAELAERPRTTWRFESDDDAWWHAQLTTLIGELEEFSNETSGLCSAGTSPRYGWGMEKRLEIASALVERTLRGSLAAERWHAAIESIRDRAQCPLYDGFVLTPQLGLLPLGRNPSTALWEFAHLPSGEPAALDDRGAAVMSEGAGLVLVLIPGGRFWMGAQKSDPSAPMYDPLAEANESPPHEVELDPYFLSKFEMTQDQWMRFTAQNPSAYGPGTAPGNVVTTSLHPVEQVSWKKAIVVLERLGLVLPTEAQWERGARAGTETPWWTGSERESIGGAANLGDRFAGANGAPAWWVYESWLDDGHTTHAPVGSYRANPFGLHDVIGNAFESCRDGYGTYALSESPGDGARVGTDPRSHIIRGGGYHTSAKRSRSSFRTDVAPDYSDYAMGLRPAMSLTP